MKKRGFGGFFLSFDVFFGVWNLNLNLFMNCCSGQKKEKKHDEREEEKYFYPQ